MLNIGTTTGGFIIKGTDDIDYKKMASLGFTHADFSKVTRPTAIYHQMNDEELKAAMEREYALAKEAGITFSQVHGGWPVEDTSEELRTENMKIQKLCVRASAFLGCKELVVHPIMPYSWRAEEDPDYAEKLNEEFFRELCEYALGYGVNICIENMPTKLHRLAGIENLVKFVKKLDYPNFFICLDTGHVHVRNEDCGDMVRACGDLLKVLHVHDNNGRTDAHTIPYGGGINWKSFKQGLADINYNGVMSLEISINCHAPEDVRERFRELSVVVAKELADI